MKQAAGGRPGPLGQATRALGLSAVGLQFGFSVIIGLGIGWLLDRLLGTRPWLMLVMLVLGFAAGIVSVYRAARAAGKEDDCS